MTSTPSSWRNDTDSPLARHRVRTSPSPCRRSGPAATSPLRSICIRLVTSVFAGSRSKVRSTFLIQNGGAAYSSRRIKGAVPSRMGKFLVSIRSSARDALLQAGLDEGVEVAVEHFLGVADLYVGAQVLDPALVEHVAADLVAPADVGLRILELLLRRHADAHLVLVEARAQHLPGLVAVPVLRAVVL